MSWADELWEQAHNDVYRKMVLHGDVSYIQHIKNPPLELQKFAMVNSNGEAIKWIKKPHVDIIAFSLITYPLALNYIKNSTEEMHTIAMKAHYKMQPGIIKSLEIFQDKTYFAYIKLKAGV